jgi:hypothetical protein
LVGVVEADVDVVEVLWAAAFSALVSLGGTISGVLFGTASETLDPPQPASTAPPSSRSATASAMREPKERSPRRPLAVVKARRSLCELWSLGCKAASG